MSYHEYYLNYLAEVRTSHAALALIVVGYLLIWAIIIWESKKDDK